MAARVEEHFKKVHDKSHAFFDCVCSIDGTVRSASRPEGSTFQLVVCNGHICKYALKFQTLTTKDGLMVQRASPVEG